jgi:membrane protein YdbS with pleckstrin-like domain
MANYATAPTPRLLRRQDLVDGEELRAETRATKLYYFPGPVTALLVILSLDYAALAAVHGWLPAVPGLTPFFQAFPAGGAGFMVDFFAVLTLGVLVLLAARYLEWMRTVYAVTSSRIIIQKGILARDLEEIPISQVRGIEVHQSFLHRLMGFGTLRVSSEGGSRVGNEDWFGIPGPFKFQRIIETASQNLSRGQSPPMAIPPPPISPIPPAPQPGRA